MRQTFLKILIYISLNKKMFGAVKKYWHKLKSVRIEKFHAIKDYSFREKITWAGESFSSFHLVCLIRFLILSNALLSFTNRGKKN